MVRQMSGVVLALALSVGLSGCYVSSAAQRSRRIVADGFDVESRGAWVAFTGPGSLLVAGGTMLVGPFFLGPSEPRIKWFRSYPGKMLPVEQVAILCHGDRATWIHAMRPMGSDLWTRARHEKWHFPRCIEVLPGSYELEVHYFLRDSEDDVERAVTRQAESTQPSSARWEAEAGGLYRLTARVGDPVPSQGPVPRRHIPRSRSLGTTWWDLQESEWTVWIERLPSWEAWDEPVREHRQAWMDYEAVRR